jgi:hypothetical protein
MIATTLFLFIWLWAAPKTTKMSKNLERSAEQRDADIN